MNREYHKWFSSTLDREMELLVFGHAGKPVLVFPTAAGRFYEYEDEGMIGCLAGRYESGRMQAFCVDGYEGQSWRNRTLPPRERALAQTQYERYLLEEVLPFIRERSLSPRVAVTGCGRGGYQAVNLALRHPDLVFDCVSMGGAFDVRGFLDGYYDEDCYFHSPLDYAGGLTDAWYLSRLREMRLVLAAGERDRALGDTMRLAESLRAANIPHWLDVWGGGTADGWPYWRQMALKFF